jgi:hypothetical protein
MEGGRDRPGFATACDGYYPRPPNPPLDPPTPPNQPYLIAARRGIRQQPLHLISGSLLPLLPTLDQVIRSNTRK